MEPTQPAPGSVSDSLGGLRHRWWLVALATIAGLTASAGWLSARDPVWESTTSVLVHPAGQDTNVVGGRTQGQVNLDTEAQLVHSTAVAAGAADRLGLTIGPPELTRQVSVEIPPNTSVLVITFAADTPEQAQAGSRAFAESYLDHREQAARADLVRQATAIEAKRDELVETLAEINEQLTGVPAGTAAGANLESQRSTASSQLNVLADRLNELATATVSAGTVISEPQLPSSPSWPQPPVVLASGAALGLVTGAAGAGLADRLARKVRRPADLPRRLGIAVLADLASDRRHAHQYEPLSWPYGPAGRAFDRLRNQLLAAAPEGRTIVVTSPEFDAVSCPVATNLAASLARYGAEVTLILATSPPGEAELAQLLAVAGSPSLADVLAGRAGLADALRYSPPHPRLRVMLAGDLAPGQLQSARLGQLLTTAAPRSGYLVVAAPATGSAADAQWVASQAGSALLVVQARQERFRQVADAAGQLRGVGTPLLGAVLVPRSRRSRERRAAPPLLGKRLPAGPDPAASTAASSNLGADQPPPVATTGGPDPR